MVVVVLDEFDDVHSVPITNVEMVCQDGVCDIVNKLIQQRCLLLWQVVVKV